MNISKRYLFIGAMILILIILMSCSVIMKYGESKLLSTGPNGPDTPKKYGIPYERIRILSGERILDGYLVITPSYKQEKYALLIFHGAKETISDWTKAQYILYNHGISSLVFDYSGHGNSTRPGSIKYLDEDAKIVYSYFLTRFPDSHNFILGFSLGNAPMLASIKYFRPIPDGVIIASAFSSLRELGQYSGSSNFFYRILSGIIPDVWNNINAVKENIAPLLVIHSDNDKSNPLSMGEKIFRAANEPKKFVLLHGLEHNAPISDSSEIWWAPVINFIKGESNGHIK